MKDNKDIVVYVGMSGGVDSSVTAALLVEQGYKVVGVYMKNWAQDLPGFDCPWRDDLADAKRVAVQLGIDFKIFDFQAEYKLKVVDYMLDAYKSGITPNPDIMCNQEIKFKAFLESALEGGADYVATGHYARTQNGTLLRAVDEDKDQTYFLYRVTKSALEKTLFPLGDYTKQQVRGMAAERGLITANKKESMGICFVGKVGIKEFLSQYVTTEPGPIIGDDGTQLGEHDGAIFYTIGQRHGLNIGGGLPVYVAAKNMETNEVFVTSNVDDDRLWQNGALLESFHAINELPHTGDVLRARTRHRGEMLEVTVGEISGTKMGLTFNDPTRTVTPGQSIVLYCHQEVVGGGIIAKPL